MTRFVLAATAFAAIAAVGCGGGDRTNSDRRANDDANQHTQAPQVTLTGCVTAGSGSATYALHNVRFGGPGQSPQSDTQHTHELGITEGSFVRLTLPSGASAKEGASGAHTDLSKYLGQRVTLTGSVVDTGASTVGTSGSSGNPSPSGDRSQAASAEHHSEKQRKEAGPIARNTSSNGMAAEVRVQTVQETGERCAAQQQTDR
jgi:hypothetical protein